MVAKSAGVKATPYRATSSWTRRLIRSTSGVVRLRLVHVRDDAIEAGIPPGLERGGDRPAGQKAQYSTRFCAEEKSDLNSKCSSRLSRRISTMNAMVGRTWAI